MTPPGVATAVLLTVACVATGCGGTYAPRPERPPAVPGTRSKPAETTSLAASAAASAFARRWVNWDSRSLPGQQRALGRLATGALADQLRADAESAAREGSRERPDLASRGRVAAVRLKLCRTRATGLVVTREQSYTDGHADLGGRRYRVYLFELVDADHAWSVSAWAPQP